MYTSYSGPPPFCPSGGGGEKPIDSTSMFQALSKNFATESTYCSYVLSIL